MIIIAIGVVAVGSYYYLHKKTAKEKTIALGPENNGSTVTVGVGDNVEIELDENPSTGYHWRLTQYKGFTELLENEYIPPEKQIPGRGGTRRFKFTILDDGTLKMAYLRSWENQPENQYSITFETQ